MKNSIKAILLFLVLRPPCFAQIGGNPSGGGSGGGGTSVNVNGSPVTSPNFNGTTPAASAGHVNAAPQVSASSVSFQVPLQLGNSAAVQDASTFAGATFDVKVAAAQAALCSASPSGGDIDARALTGAQSLAASITIGASCKTRLKLGATTLTRASNAQIILSSYSKILGAGVGASVITGSDNVVSVIMNAETTVDDVDIINTLNNGIQNACVSEANSSVIERSRMRCYPGIYLPAINSRIYQTEFNSLLSNGQWNFVDSVSEIASYPNVRIMEANPSAPSNGANVYLGIPAYSDALLAFVQTKANTFKFSWPETVSSGALGTTIPTWASATAYHFGDAVTDGQISASTLGSGGGSYGAADTFTVNSAITGATLATGHVTAAPGGVVSTYVIDTHGTGYAVANGVATTATSGSGVGLTINVTGIKGLVMMCYTNNTLTGNNLNLSTPSCGTSGASMPTWAGTQGSLDSDNGMQWLEVTGADMVLDGTTAINNDIENMLTTGPVLFTSGATEIANTVHKASSTSSYYSAGIGFCLGRALSAGLATALTTCDQNPYTTTTTIPAPSGSHSQAMFVGGVSANVWKGLNGLYTGLELFNQGQFDNFGPATVYNVPTPVAPTLAVVGTPGATPTNYYVVAHCNGMTSAPSPAASINPPDTLNASAYVTILPPIGTQFVAGYRYGYWSAGCTWDVLKGTTATSILLNQTLVIGGSANAFSVTALKDTGQATAAYVPLALPTPSPLAAPYVKVGTSAGLSATPGDSGSYFYLPPYNAKPLWLPAMNENNPGDLAVTAIGAPTGPTLTTACVAGGSTWKYAVVGNTQFGTTPVSTTSTLATGCTIVSGATDQNYIAVAPKPGVLSWDVYLIQFPGGATCGGAGCVTGKLTSSPVAQSANAQSTAVQVIFTHSTQNGDGSTAPTVDTTGQIRPAILMLPSAAGAAPTVAGQTQYDSTSTATAHGNGSTTNYDAYVAGAAQPTGDYVKWGANYSLTDGGAFVGASGVTGSIGGSPVIGACVTGTATVTGATTAMTATASPNTYPGDGYTWNSQVTSSNTVTVYVCNAGTAGALTSSTYNVAVGSGSIQSTATSFTSSCTAGTITSNGTTYVLFPNGLATTCTGSHGATTVNNFSHGGTVKNLYCTSGVAGHAAGSGIMVVNITGSSPSTAVTCTIGTGTSCNDTTHTAAVIAGDHWTVSLLGVTGETLSGLSCTFDETIP